MRDKIIGLFTTKLQNDDSMLFFEKFHKYAYKNNFGVVTFYTEIDYYDKSEGDSAGTFYMLNYNMIDAIVIDGLKIENEKIIESIIEKANAANVPAYVVNVYNKNCTSFVFDIENAIDDILKHIINVHSCKDICMIVGNVSKIEADILTSSYKKVLKENDIIFDSSKVYHGQYSSEDIWEELPNIISEKTDAVVCGTDELAIVVGKYFEKTYPGKPICIVGAGGSMRAKYYSPMISTIDKDYDALVKRLMNRILMDFKSSYRVGEEHILAEANFHESCGCHESEFPDYRKKVMELYANQVADQNIGLKLASLGKDISKSSSISELSKIFSDKIPKGCCICVRDDFMQNAFRTEKIEENPIPNEKFYIIADNREHSSLWATFPLKEMCVGMDKMLEDNAPIIIVPIKYLKFYFGYTVYHGFDYAETCFTLEHFSSVMNIVVGRNLVEKKYKYVSSELFHANESVKRMQYRDVMTGMFNYQGLVLGMKTLIEECVKKKMNISLACIDLERLENINDIYGHSEGDNAIQTFAKVIAECADEESLCAHIGSDEFVIIIPTEIGNDASVIEAFFKAIDSRLEEYNNISGKNYSLETNQIYITVEASEGLDIKKIIDEAMNKKQLIKLNRRGIHDFNQTVTKKTNQSSSISDIIDNNRFKYAYQPIVNAKTGEIYAYEALMRSDGDEHISPLSILQCATDENRLYDIEKATFFNVLNQVSSCKEELSDKKIFLNSIPGYQLDSMDYAKVKRKFSDVFGFLVVEITEQNEMNDDNLSVMRKRSDKEGFEVAIDDFGSGFSNTSSLLRYLPNYVKIDRLLISDINSEPKKQHFVKNIIEFAHTNGFLALAEGVETLDELRAVIHLDVDLIQGFYTAKPSFGFIKSIPDNIKHEILEANISGLSSAKKKLYVVGHESKILLMKLALSQYTGAVVASQDVTIVGNPDFSASVSIKVLDNSNARIVLRNVKLNSEDDNPCIEIGKNSHVTIVVEENNEILQRGIHVPKGSSLTFEGDGSMNIFVNGTDCFGVGAGWNDECGDINFNMDGALKIKADGNKCIGIGGGKYAGNSGITITKGKVDVDVQGSAGVGIGFISESGPIRISDCNTDIDMRVASGVAVGTLESEPDVYMNNLRITVNSSGNRVCGIGSLARIGGDIHISSGRVILNISGRCVYLIGNSFGGMNISIESARLDLSGEGNECLGIGTMESDAIMWVSKVTLNISIRSGKNVIIGALKEKLFFDDVIENYVIS